jgi:hypothetical protein
MSLLEADVEIVKLARLLGTDAGELGVLRQIEWREPRDLRDQMTVVMFENDRQMLQRVASTTRLVPPKITAAIGERAFGPLLCARVAGLLDPSRAVDIIAHLPTPFLADVAAQLDPRRASRVIAEIPPQQIAQITRELAARADLWAPTVRFASELEPSTQNEVATLVAALDDDVLDGLLAAGRG